MAADLSPLEQAAARVGLPGLKARIVPHDRRRGWWFRWGNSELLVSDRVIDRCPPEDASALLLNEILRRGMGRRTWTWSLLRAGFILLVLVALFWAWSALNPRVIEGNGSAPWWLYAINDSVLYGPGIFVVLACVIWLIRRAAVSELADDETVRLLGDATPLVRGLNEMNFEEIHLAGKVLPARPDLHRRAERLVAKHGLCDAQPPT